MHFFRSTIIILTLAFIFQPLAPAVVLAAPRPMEDTQSAPPGAVESGSLPPFPEDRTLVIDWTSVDWDQVVSLPADMREFNEKLEELQEAGRFSEIGQLKPRKRLMSDPEVLAHYGAPQEVRDLIRGYVLNSKRETTLEHKAALLSMLKLRLRSAQLSAGQIPTSSPRARDNENNVIDVSLAPRINMRNGRSIKPATAVNSKSVLKSADPVDPRDDVFLKPVKAREKPGKVSFLPWLRSLLIDEALAYYDPPTPIIEYYDGIEKEPVSYLLYQLAQTQNDDGSWGSYNHYVNTAEITLQLSNMGRIDNDQHALAIAYLTNAIPLNTREIAIKARLLADLNLDNPTLADLQSIAPNSDGAYGLRPGDASDVETTLDVITAYVHATRSLPQNAVSHVLSTIEADGQMRYSSGGPVSWHLMNQAVRQLYSIRESVIGGTSVENRLQLVVSALANQFSVDADISSIDSVDIFQTLRTFDLYANHQPEQGRLWTEAVARTNASYSLNTNLTEVVAALGALAQPDLAVSVTAGADWTNGAPILFTVTITNRGYAPSQSGSLYWAADDFMLTTGRAVGPLPPNGTSVFTVTFDSILTRELIGDTRVLFYAESDNESFYDNNWAEQNKTVAPNAQNLPALPLYHIEHQYSINGLPALNIRWSRKDDPNRVKYVIVFRRSGSSAWGFYGIDNEQNGAFLAPFGEGDSWDVTAGVLHSDLQTVTWLDDYSTIAMSANDALNTSTVNARATIDNAPASDFSTYGYTVSGKTDADGNITYENVQNGSTASGVDVTQYERLVTKFAVPKNSTVNDVRLFSHLRADTSVPTISGFEIRYHSNFIVKNQQTAELLAWVGDNILVKEVDFYYFDPNRNVWIYLGAELAANTQALLKWNIPEDLLGTGYKVRAVARDFRGNESAPAEWGTFEIINGAPPTGSVAIEGLVNNQWLLGEAKNVTWTSSGANAIAYVDTGWLYYRSDAAEYIGGSVNAAEGSISYTIPLVLNYTSDSAYILLNVCDGANNCTQITSDTFQIVDPSPPPPLPWQTPTTVPSVSSESGVDRYIQRVFEKDDGSLAVLYLEYSGTSQADPGQYRRVVYRTYVDGAWGDPVIVAEHLYRSGFTADIAYRNVTGALDSTGALHVAYDQRITTYTADPESWRSDLNAQQVNYTYISSAGVVSGQRVVSTGVLSSYAPRVVITDGNKPMVVFDGGYDYLTDTGSTTLYRSEDLGGNGWSSPAVIDVGAAFSVIAENSDIVLSYRSSNQLKMIKRSSNGAWSDPITIVDDGLSRSDISLFAKGDNAYDVFYKRYNSSAGKYSIDRMKITVNTNNTAAIAAARETVVGSSDGKDIRVYRAMPNGTGYHIAYLQYSNSQHKAEYLYFDDSGAHFSALASPLLLGLDNALFDAYSRNDQVSIYFVGVLGGKDTLFYNQADQSDNVASLAASGQGSGAVVLPSDSLVTSNNNLGQYTTQTITFVPKSYVLGPGDLVVAWSDGFSLSFMAPIIDVSISGGGVTWDTAVNTDLNMADRVLTSRWTSGTLTPGSAVSIRIAFVKNPATEGHYGISVATGPHNFAVPADSRSYGAYINNGAVSVTAFVPYPLTNPEIGTILPTPTILISSGGSQVITFKMRDVNFDAVSYSLTPSTGTISVAPDPASPVVGSPAWTTISFTYTADGGTGEQAITITADDNEPTGGGVVTQDIQLLIL